MNLFTVILVFHVLRLNLCVALNQVCSERQFLNSSGICIDCTICEQPDKNIVIRPCSAYKDTLCGSISDININLPGIKIKPAYENDLSDQYLTINTDADLSKKNIADILKKLSEPEKSASAAKTLLDTSSFYYYDDEDDSEEDDVEYEEDKDNSTSNTTAKSSNSNFLTVKNEQSSTPELFTESTKKQIEKTKSKPTKNSILSDMFNYDEVSVMDPDTLIQKTKKLRKWKSKDDNTIEINDHSLKIGDTKFNIGNELSDDGRWLQLSHPHIVDKKIYVDLEQNSVVNKKGSTFFSSGEIQTDQRYADEMSKLLNETSSVLNEKPTVHNQTSQVNPLRGDDDENNNNELKILDDNDNGSDDEDDDDDDEDEDEDEYEEVGEDDEVKENVDDDDEFSIYHDFISSNNSDRTDSIEKTDDMDDDYYSQDNDFYKDRIDVQQSNKYITSEPFVSTANWQILILVAAMSACLLFFIVVSGYICIYMRKRRHFKTTFVADIEDISVRVNLMQHARFEVDDSNKIKNYISHLKGVKSTHEILPKIYVRSK